MSRRSPQIHAARRAQTHEPIRANLIARYLHHGIALGYEIRRDGVSSAKGPYDDDLQLCSTVTPV